MSKTPNFDRALNEILPLTFPEKVGGQPHQKICQQCGRVFDIFQEDIEFYKMLRVPAPKLCPDCRLQRRLAWRINFLPIFYKKTCSAPGHNEKIITFYSEENPVKVFDDEYYLSDAWEPLDYAKNYDFSRPFFEQFNEFSLKIPHQSLHKDPESVDCDYVVSGASSKNCYYVATPYRSENVYYARLPSYSKDCLDVNYAHHCEQCYGGSNLDHCYNCNFCYDCLNCLDCYFLFDCKNCQNCFGSTNLRNKKYCIFNKQYSENDYWRMVDKIKVQMLKRGEYGEFFPLKYSPFPYQDSNAQVEFPLSKEEIIKRGCHWQEEVKSEIDLSKFKVLKAEQVPDDIKDVSDDILNSVIICEQTGKPFRITKFELDFYRKKNLPLPTIHPFQRIKNRFVFCHPYKLWQYPCSKCGKTMHSGWDPAKKYKVYCEQCYLAEMV